SMNTAQPASFPPGVSGSGGMMRSAMASIAWPSGPEKKTHGPGFTRMGGLPAFGVHGRPPVTTAARLDKPPSRKTAVLANKSRRLKLMTNTNRLRFLEVWTIHGVSQSSLQVGSVHPKADSQSTAPDIGDDFVTKAVDCSSKVISCVCSADYG